MPCLADTAFACQPRPWAAILATLWLATLSPALGSPAQARDLGVQGRMFPIAEPDILGVIEARLQVLNEAGEIERLNREFRQRAVATVRRPPPVRGIGKTQEQRSWYYDPAIVLEDDLLDHEGHLIQARGTRINPLEITGLSQKILFIDGDDDEQVSWALDQRARSGRAKIVLVSGAPLELIEAHGIPFFFDQRGTLIARFGISQVPAMVEQAGSTLRISEVKP